MSIQIPPLLQVLKEACEPLEYQWELVDKRSKNLAKVSYGKRFFFTSNTTVGAYPINPNFAAQVVKDKAWTYEILRQNGFKIPKGKSFFLRDSWKNYYEIKQEVPQAVKYAKTLGYPVFVKPNRHSCEWLAEKIQNEAQLKKHLKKIAETDYIGIVQEFVPLPEYRIFVLNGKVEFWYERRHAPGASAANLSAGGTLENYSEKTPAAVEKWAKDIAETFGLPVCGIDLFADGNPNNPKNFMVIEVNASPSLTGIYELGKKEKAFSIWKKILDEYFLAP